MAMPADSQLPTDKIRVNDQPSLEANLLQIDFMAPDFDRRKTPERVGYADPPLSVIFVVANQWLGVLRAVLRSPFMQPLNERQQFWRLDYLTDSGDALPEADGLFRMAYTFPIRVKLNALDKKYWDTAVGLSFQSRFLLKRALVGREVRHFVEDSHWEVS